MKTIKELCDLVRETSYSIHLYHGHGHLEKVYENALVNRLRKAGVEIQQQHPLTSRFASLLFALFAFLCGQFS